MSNHSSAADRLERLVREMLRLTAEQIGAGQPEGGLLEYPARILDTPDTPHANKFDHARIYPDAKEFGSSDISVVQAELSHARREIKHLHHEKNQLQSELDQAHRIFEQIHRHPIAGPIVRLRQSVVDWLARFRTRREQIQADLPSPEKLPDESPIAKKTPSSSLSGS